MRTVVKTVLRSFGASLATNAVTLESQQRPDLSNQMKRRDITVCDNCFFPVSTGCLDKSHHLDIKRKSDSLSPVYKLNGVEVTGFEELQDKECDYYPNNSTRGDSNILNMEVKNNINEQNVNSFNIIFALKNIRFINSIVLKQDYSVFLTTANYIQRLLHIKAVKKDLIQFISGAMYDLALERRTGKGLSKEQVSLLLSLTNIPTNHIEDFTRMKTLLVSHLNNDLKSVSIVEYLEIILKIDLHFTSDNLLESHALLIEIATVLSTSCELTFFSLACQAISLVAVAARHVSFDPSFVQQYSTFINNFPMIFVSPVRLHQFEVLDNVSDHNIKHCSESIVRFLAMYYDRCSNKPPGSVTKKLSARRDSARDISCQLEPVIEEEERVQWMDQQSLDICELMEKLGRVKLALHSQITGKQRQRNRRAKKKLCRQLKKYDRSAMDRVNYKPLSIDDEDSAISSSSNMTSPAHSPSSF